MSLLKNKYKKTKLGNLPIEWKMVKISDVGNVITGSTPSTKKSEYYGGDYFFVSPMDIDNKKYVESTVRKLSKKGFRISRIVPKNSVLVTCIGSTIGKIAMSNRKVATNQQINSIDCYDEFNCDYIYYALDYYFNLRKRMFIAHQAVPIINKTEFSKFPLPVPKIEEQDKIATIFSTWDKAIELKEKLIEQKKEQKKGLMQKLLTGEVRLPGTDGNFSMYKLNQILIVRHGRNQKKVEDENGAYPILGTGGQIGRANQYLYDKESVLIGRKGTIDRPFYMDKPFWTVDTLFYTEINEGFYPKYIYYLFNRIPWRRFNEASGVPSLSASTIGSIKVSIPNYKTQKRIALILTKVDEELFLLKKEVQLLNEQKKGLMQRLLTGKIRVKV